MTIPTWGGLSSKAMTHTYVLNLMLYLFQRYKGQLDFLFTCLSYTVSSIQQVICRRPKSHFFYPICICLPHLGWLYWNFTSIVGVRKLKSLRYHAVLFAWWNLTVLVEHRLVTDRQTERQTDRQRDEWADRHRAVAYTAKENCTSAYATKEKRLCCTPI